MTLRSPYKTLPRSIELGNEVRPHIGHNTRGEQVVRGKGVPHVYSMTISLPCTDDAAEYDHSEHRAHTMLPYFIIFHHFLIFPIFTENAQSFIPLEIFYRIFF